MKATFSVLVFLLLFLSVSAQQKGPNISFENESYNFGKIPESDGTVSYVYNFTNTGSDPLIIQHVQPSCGCTTPEWSRQPVVPGGKGFIRATFNPAGRPGSFTKTIAVTSNALQHTVVLKFSGEVISKSPEAEKYPYPIDNLRFSSVYLTFGKVAPDKPAVRKLEVFNSGSSPAVISFAGAPAHMEVMVNPSTVKPGQRAVIEFTFNAGRKNDWGFVSDAVYYTVNGKKDSKYKINISATIQDDYTGASPQQLANAPRLALDKKEINIGKVKAGTNVELSFKLRNMGKTNLVIRKIATSCGCTDVKARENVLKPGSSGEITGVFSSSGQKGPVNKAITVITNDPDNLSTVLYIRGIVE